jgi:hypothetical protein
MWCAGIVFSVIPTSGYGHYDVPGVYMLCRREQKGVHILHIGHAASLAERLGPSHPLWREAARRGMNEVHIHLLARTEAQRLSVEQHLKSRYFTPMNRGALANALAAFAQRAGHGLRAMVSLPPARLADLFAANLPRSPFGLDFNLFRSR